jgi:hypothetical protein
MRWMKPGLRNTISALLGTETRKFSPEALEPVRKAMLDALGTEGAALNPRLKHRLMYLHDVHALWYARSEMVVVLSQLHGEAKAVDKVIGLSPVFQGLLPKSLMESCRLRR